MRKCQIIERWYYDNLFETGFFCGINNIVMESLLFVKHIKALGLTIMPVSAINIRAPPAITVDIMVNKLFIISCISSKTCASVKKIS